MKITKKYLLALMTGLAFLASSTLMAQDWSKEQKEVWQSVENGWAAWASGTDGNVQGQMEGDV